MALSDAERSVGQRRFHQQAAFEAVCYVCKGTLLIEFSRRIGFSLVQISLLSTVYTVGGLAAVAAALFYERSASNRRFTMASYGISLLLFYGALLLGLLARGPAASWSMLALILLSTMAYSFYMTPFYPWHQDLVEQGSWGRYMGRRLRLWNVVEIVAYLAFSKCIDFLDGGSALVGYALVFGVAFVCGLMSLLSLSRVPDVARRPETGRRLWRDIVLPPLRDRSFVAFCLVAFLFYFGLAFYVPFTNLLLLEQLKVSLFAISALSAASAVVGIAFYKVWGVVADHVGSRVVLQTALVLFVLAPGVWLAAYAGNRSLLLLPFVLTNAYGALGIAGSAWILSTSCLQMSLTPAEGKSSYVGVFRFHCACGTFAGALCAGAVAKELPATLGWSVGGAPVPSCLVMLQAAAGVMALCLLLSFAIRERPLPSRRLFRELLRPGSPPSSRA